MVYANANANMFEQQLQRESVFLERDAMNIHFVPEILPCRETQLNFITENLSTLFSARKANNLFVYGKTGTGKTVTIKKVFSELEEFAKTKQKTIKCAYVNCRNYATKYKTIQKALSGLLPQNNYLGFSSSFIQDKLVDFLNLGNKLVIALDEIDKVKDLDELVYFLTRINDELKNGSITIIGISNNLMFKERLDQRTKSGLCEVEAIFPTYNAIELKKILEERTRIAIKENSIEEGAIGLAAAIAAKESGDARTAVMLLQRAGEICDREQKKKITEKEVLKAKEIVEEEIICEMMISLPTQQQMVLLSISNLTTTKNPTQKLTGNQTDTLITTGEAFEEYKEIAKKAKETMVSSRWFREYLNELEMLGLILTTQSSYGQRGQTRFIRLGYEAGKIKKVIEKALFQ